MESGSGRSVTRQNYRKYYHKSSLDVAKQIDIIREFPLEEKPTSREEFLEAFNIAMQLYEKQDSEVN